MISGAAGALAVVVTDLTADDGVLDHLTAAERLNVLYMTMFVCGKAQIVFAWLRLANLVKLIPQTGLIGFLDGLAISTFVRLQHKIHDFLFSQQVCGLFRAMGGDAMIGQSTINI